jgi:hypothetical protein
MNTEFKKKVSKLLLAKIETTYQKGSCGELGEPIKTISYYHLNDLVNEISEILADDFEPKKCMPDGINSREDYEEYLKDIGYEKYVKNLEYFKENHVGLYAFTKELGTIFENIPNKKGCKTAVEAYLVQQIEYLKSIVFRIS